MHSSTALFHTAVFLSAVTVAQTYTGNSACPGVIFADGQNPSSTCCVGGVQAPVTVSVCAGWPLCGTNSATVTPSQAPISCATLIEASDSPDFTSECSSASSSMAASGTHYVTTITPQVMIGGATPGSSGNTGAPSTTSGGDSASGSSGGSTVTSGTTGSESTASTPSSTTSGTSESSSGAVTGTIVDLLYVVAPLVFLGFAVLA